MRCLTNQQWLLGAEMAQRPNFRPNQPLIEFLGIPGLDEGMDQEILEISELGVDYRKGLRHTQDMTNTNTTTATPLALVDMVLQMIDDRKAFAAANGFTASDDEIANNIKASLIRMMSA